MPEMNTDAALTLRVASVTNVQNLATAIAKNIEEHRELTLSCIGVQSVSQGIKGVAIANSKMAPSGIVLLICPAFRHIRLGDEQQGDVRTVLDLLIVKHRIGS